MTDFRTISITLILVFSCWKGFGQTTKTIDSLEIQYQICLNNGEYMAGCSKTFYLQMDSILNVQYKKLYSQCDSIQKKNLHQNQGTWILERDKLFERMRQQLEKDAKKNGYDGGEDEKMILNDKKATFIKKRVVELLNNSPQTYSKI